MTSPFAKLLQRMPDDPEFWLARFQMDISLLIDHRMKDRGVTLEQLCVAAKMSKRRATLMLRGDADLRLSELNRVCEALGLYPVLRPTSLHDERKKL